MCSQDIRITVVLGSLNRGHIIRYTIRSLRSCKAIESIIVVDGGSTDGTCEWLARQRDIRTIIQPNYLVADGDGRLRKKYSWGQFMNLGFRAATSEWIMMVSDDLVLYPDCMDRAIRCLVREGRGLGGGAIFWRDYPRDRHFHVKLVPGDFVHVNHGFFRKEALESIGYINEDDFEFYGADGDLSIRLNLAGWRTIALEGCFAEHLNHRSKVGRMVRRLLGSSAFESNDMKTFERKYAHFSYTQKALLSPFPSARSPGIQFWLADPLACVDGTVRRLISRFALR